MRTSTHTCVERNHDDRNYPAWEFQDRRGKLVERNRGRGIGVAIKSNVKGLNYLLLETIAKSLTLALCILNGVCSVSHVSLVC